MPAKKRECNRRRQYPYGLMTLQTEHLRAVRQHFRPVSDEKQGLVLCLVLQIQQQLFFRGSIQCRSRFVQQQDIAFAEQGAGYIIM